MRQNSSLAHIQLRSPSPSEMDPTDAHDEDRQLSGAPESPLKRARLHSSPSREIASVPEYPSPPQRPHSGSTEHGGIEKEFEEVSAPLMSKNKFHLNKDSRHPSSSPPADSPHSPVSRPSLNSHFNTIIMHTGTKPRKSLPAGRNTEARRPARMPYTAEQDDFIRFVRDDLSLSWEISAQFYNDYWHPDNDGKREVPGLQSRYYRLLDKPMREKKRKFGKHGKEAKDSSVGRPEEGILMKTTRRYYWMEGMFETQAERATWQQERQKQEEVAEPASKRQRRENEVSQDVSESTDEEDYDEDEYMETRNEDQKYEDVHSTGTFHEVDRRQQTGVDC